MDGKEALQKQLLGAKASGGSAGGSDKSVLSLMMEVEDLKSKVRGMDCGGRWRVLSRDVCLCSLPRWSLVWVARRRRRSLRSW